MESSSNEATCMSASSSWTLDGNLHITAGRPRGAPLLEGENPMAKKLKKGKKIAAKKSLRMRMGG